MRTVALCLVFATGLIGTSAWCRAQDGPTSWPRRATNLERSVQHYEALGFRVQRRSDRQVSFAPRGGSGLTLMLDDAPAPPTGSRVDPLAAERALVVPVDGVRAERHRLERAGQEYELLVARPTGRASLLVLDPDGHRTILRSPKDVGEVAIPGPGELNPLVMEVIANFPADGTHRYYWPKSGGWKGNTKDLEYRGEVIAAGDEKGRCYCCGLTFEVFLDAYRLWSARNGRPWQIADLDVDGVRELQRQWFGSAADKSCIHTALVDNRLGFRVTDWDDARPGDFVQLWRAKGSGHSVVFVAWEREGDEPDGRITGIRYWSTQGSTNGIGERVESFEPSAGKNRVLRDEFWLCRVGDPGAR